MDVSDLLATNAILIEKYTALKTDDLAKRIFETMDADGNGVVNKDELFQSSVKEMLIPFWKDLDFDNDGNLTGEEWAKYLKKVKIKKGELAYRRYLSYMAVHGVIDVSDLVLANDANNAQGGRGTGGCGSGGRCMVQ